MEIDDAPTTQTIGSMRIPKTASRLIRVGSNCHRFIMLVNGKFRSFTTHEKDVLFDLAALFSMLNQRVLPGHLQGSQFWSFWIGLGVSILLSCPVAFALPTGWEVVSGNVSFDQNGNVLNVTSSSNQAIVNYQNFNVANGETVNFNFLLSGSSILNRVLGGGPSTIAGVLAGNGQVLLVNPAGINFASTANLNVGGLMASTLNIRNSDYLAGQYVFTKDPVLSPGAVNNQGHIQADNYVALLGSSIKNDGTITAPHVALAVGDQVHVKVSPDMSLQVSVDQALKEQVAAYKEAIANGGSIHAQQVDLQAKVLEGKLYDSVVNNTGMIHATGATQDAAGNIVLYGAGDDGAALVQNTGTLDASGGIANANGGSIHMEGNSAVNSGQILAASAQGGQGGAVSMLGNSVVNLSGSTINVSGDQGGGTALIGGDYQGKNASIRNAQFNYMDANANITANAETQGNGGKVILWSDDKTIFQGHIEAKGGAQGGNGGFVETSGHNTLRATGTVDASAPQGKGGQWLLDPNNITIQNGGGDTNISCSGGGPNTCSTTDDSAIVTSGTINTSLNAGTDVIIQTTSSGANTQDGDITIAAGTTINKTAGGDATLTLKANNSILSNGTSGSHATISSSSGKLNVVLNADTDQGSDGGKGGAINLTYTDITSNGGNITLGGGANPSTTGALGTTANDDGIVLSGSMLTAGAGAVSLRGTGRSVAGNNDQYGVKLDTGSQISAAGGTIDVNGTGGAGDSSNSGIHLDNSLITSLNGDVTLSGAGHGTGMYNFGLSLYNGGQITSTGVAKLNLTGTAGSGTTLNHGIVLNGNSGTSTYITSLNGDVTLNGTGGGTGASNYGVYLLNGGKISSTGSALLNITGQGSTTGTSTNYGVYLTGANSLITSVDGDTTLSGTGGGNGTSTDNYGVYLYSGGEITSTGSAKLNLTGTGGNGTDNNYGLFLDGNSATNTYITSLNGDVTVTGLGKGSGAQNYGLYLLNGGKISSTGSALLDITGQSTTTGTITNHGIYLTGANSLITSATGDVTLNATGRGSGGGTSDSYGLYLLNGGQITSTGTAKLDITGTVSAGYDRGIGIYLTGANSLITSLDGDVTINATGYGSHDWNYGLALANGGQITSTGLAKLNITGKSNAVINPGATFNYGILLGGANSQITSATGDVTIDATGGGNKLGYGLYLTNGGQITSTGAAKLNITGTGANGSLNNYGLYIDGNGGTNTYITSLNGDVTLSGTGGGSGTDNYGLYLLGGGQITSTGSALLNITGQGSTTGTSTNYGVYLNGTNSLLTSATGDVTLNATGGGNGTSTDNYGLYLLDGGQITSTGAAKLNITGNGGNGTDTNIGVLVTNANSLIRSQTGNVSVTGYGNGSGVQNYGLYLTNGGQIISTGTAKLNLTGTANSGTDDTVGLALSDANTLITSVDGDVTLNGTGGGSGNWTYGVFLEDGGQITSTGLAKINITGQGGTAGTSESHGIYLTGANSLIASLNGDVTLSGTGGGNGTSTDNYGLYLLDGGQITSTGTAKLNLTGIGGSGADENSGIYLDGNGAANTYITSATGDVTLSGTGGGTGTDNYGVYLLNGGKISSTGTALLNITGQGSTTGTDTNYGVYLTGANSLISSATGDVTVNGTGGGSGTDNYGVYLLNGGKISSTGTALLNITGQGSTTGTNTNYGVYLDGNGGNSTYITSLNGNVTLNGTGGGTGVGNYGLSLYDGGQITSTGNALLNITATGSTTGTNNNYGSYLYRTNSRITSATGSITLTGTGGGNGTGTGNIGINLFNGGNISSTGTATLNITGAGGNGTNDNTGVLVNGSPSNTWISSVDGDMTITATGHGTGVNNYGLMISNSGTIFSTGAAKINITGQGSTTGTGTNHGVYVSGGGLLTSVTGDVTVNATGGGNGTNTDNYGLYVRNGSQITSTGAAKLNLTGIGGNGKDRNHGVYLANGQITSATGDVTVSGTGNGTGTDNYGVYLLNGGKISSTGTALLNITGQGSTTGTTLNFGVYCYGANSLITSATGDLTLNATGGGSGTGNYGVFLRDGGQISSTGSALLNITGQGSTTGTSTNHGIYLSGANSLLTSLNGNVTVSGTGGGSGVGTTNHGLYLYNGGAITSTGSADLDLTGIKGANTSYGIASDTGSNVLGDNTMTGDLTLNTDTLSLANLQLRTTGNLNFTPHTSSTSIGINGGAGSLQVDTSLIDASVVHPSKLVIGDSATGTGVVTIGNGWDFSATNIPAVEVYGGSMTTGSITAGANSLLLRARTGNITLNTGATLSSNAAGNALILAAEGNFLNNAGSSTLSTPSGRWLVYAQDSHTSLEGNLPGNRLYSQTYAGNPPSSILGAGNFFLYQNNVSVAPSSGAFNGNSLNVLAIPSLLIPIVYSSPLAPQSSGGSVLEQVPLLSPSYISPQAQPISSVAQPLSLSVQPINHVSHPSSTLTSPTDPKLQLQELQSSELTPAAKPASWRLKLNTAGNTVRILDVNTQQTIAEIAVGKQPIALVENADGSRAFVANEQDRTISVIDIPSQTVVQTIPINIQPGSLEFSVDGGQLHVLGQDGFSSVTIDTLRMQVLPANTNSQENDVSRQVRYQQSQQIQKSLNRLITHYFRED